MSSQQKCESLQMIESMDANVRRFYKVERMNQEALSYYK
jgi:hypothetical protein